MLAWLAAGDDGESEHRELDAYLIAAHHGKVRMSLRSLPGETEPKESGRLFARGVWDRDVLPAFELPDGRRFDGVELDLSLMRLGEGSWFERTLALRDAEHLGPFRLALLETILRIADGRASHKEEAGAYNA
jgi:CRISPR-associated endonuclease/helicase Cas3